MKNIRRYRCGPAAAAWTHTMFWTILFFGIPALALAAAAWGIWRRKWYAFLPALAVGAVGWTIDDQVWRAAEFLEACVSHSPASQVLALLLGNAAALMSFGAMWAGWSRCSRFWRALVLAAVPASLAPLEANELILLCFLTMPMLAGAAYWLRERSDRGSRTPLREEPKGVKGNRRNQFSLRKLLLVFVVLGLVATAIRSVWTGHAVLWEPSLLALAGTMVVCALAAAAPAIAHGSGRKWLLAGAAAIVLGIASWRWLAWDADPLGMARYLESRFPRGTVAFLVEGEIFFLVLLLLLSGVYSLVQRNGASLATGRLARIALAGLIAGASLPLVGIYPTLIAPPATVSPLPLSEACAALLRTAVQIRDLQSQNAPRAAFLSSLLELERTMPIAGHVTHDPVELARRRLYPGFGADPAVSLRQELQWETARAIYENRDRDVLRLARIQWRAGQTLSQGGTFEDYSTATWLIEWLADRALIIVVPQLTDDECRATLREAQALEQALPQYPTVLAFDSYWRSAGVGWRDRLQDAAAWMVADQSGRTERITEPVFAELHKFNVASLRTVQYVLALELHRREQGAFPDELSTIEAEYDLPPLIDGYTDHAPVYRKTGDGYLLYSVGKNGKDDGGVFADKWVFSPNIAFDINLVPDRAEHNRYWMKYPQVTGTTPAPGQTSPSTVQTPATGDTK